MSYFTRMKIERAKELLRDKSLTISQITETLSFEASDHFSKTFKKYVHITPPNTENPPFFRPKRRINA